MDKHAWFESEDADSKPSNVIKLKLPPRKLLNGWTPEQMKLYCRLVCEDRKDG